MMRSVLPPNGGAGGRDDIAGARKTSTGSLSETPYFRPSVRKNASIGKPIRSPYFLGSLEQLRK